MRSDTSIEPRNRIMLNHLKTGAVLATLACSTLLVGCDDETDVRTIISPPDTVIVTQTDTVTLGDTITAFAQVERLANPLAMEVPVEKRFHALHDATPPARDNMNFRDDYVAFVTQVAGRDTAYANVIADVLLGTSANPGDKLKVFTTRAPGVTAAMANDPSNMGGGAVGWLTYVLDPTNGYGGRKLRGDDVVDKAAGVVFGSLAGNTNNVSPGLVTDNVGNTNPAPLATFPYFPGPNPAP